MLPRPGRTLATALTALCLLGLILRDSAAQAPSETARARPPTLIIALPQMTWRTASVSEMPALKQALDRSSIGLIFVARASDADPNRTWVTLGAGRASVAGSGVDGGLPGGDLQVSAKALAAANDTAKTSAHPGLLGALLEKASISTAIVASGDYPEGVVPASVALVMNESGRVDRGWLDTPVEMTVEGKRIDREDFGQKIASALAHADVVLVDLTGVGPPSEADAIIADAAETLAETARAARGKGRLMLLTALAPPADPSFPPALGFVAIEEIGRRRPMRLLASASTRWRGLVTAADVAPTILAYYDALPAAGIPSIAGRVMRPAGARNARAALDNLSVMMSERFRLAEVAGTVYACYMVVLSALVFISGVRRRRYAWLAEPALIGALFPIGLLLAPLAGVGIARQLLVAAGLTIGGALLVSRTPRAVQTLSVAMLVGAAIIALDVVIGSPLMRQSALGFRAMTGSRFYGIGNEYVGVLGAMLVIGLAAALQQNQRRIGEAVALAALVLLVIGAPWWGANWGGYISVMIGLMGAAVLASRRPVQAVALAALVVAVGAVLPAALDLLRPAAVRSHIGTAAAALLDGRTGLLGDMFWRKVHLNWAVARRGGFWWVLASIPLAAIWLQARPRTPASGAFARDRLLAAGIGGGLIFSIVAMVVNDSGVGALVMSMAVVFSVVAYIGARGE